LEYQGEAWSFFEINNFAEKKEEINKLNSDTVEINNWWREEAEINNFVPVANPNIICHFLTTSYKILSMDYCSLQQ